VADYRLALTESAKKELDKLPGSAAGRIVTRIEKLADNPRPSGCRKLKGGVNERRIRIGDYRVVYTIEDNTKPWMSPASPTARRLIDHDRRGWRSDWTYAGALLSALIAGAGNRAAALPPILRAAPPAYNLEFTVIRKKGAAREAGVTLLQI
jgi:mRNA interferase RelE/StbE